MPTSTVKRLTRRDWRLAVALLAALAASACTRRAVRSQKQHDAAEAQLVAHMFPGCAEDASSSADELILFCPEQALFFGVKDVTERSPDRVFNAWLAELTDRADGALDVLERTQLKHFGPQVTALYVRLRTPQMPEGGYVEWIVALTETNGRQRRLWCSATSSEQTGRQRCEHDLVSLALLDLPRR